MRLRKEPDAMQEQEVLLIAEFGYAQATTSQHIKKLVDARLLETRKSDKFTYLYANLGMVQQHVNAVRKFD